MSAVAEFLRTTFHAESDLLSFRPDVLHWKYFSVHPDWLLARSYVVKKDAAIVAHGGVWPLRLARAATEINAIHLIDWAASRSAPGAGLTLLRKLAGMTGVLLTIGGSADTRAILVRIGYRQIGELKLRARVVRPWLQFRNTPRRGWKTLLRLARNTMWSLPALSSAPAGWRAARVLRFDSSLDSVLKNASANVFTSARTVAGLNHALTCPAASFAAFVVFRSERPCGYFLINQVGNQTRIVDLRVHSSDPEGWRAACALATRTAAAMPETCEIVSGFSLDQVNDALEKMGFHPRGTIPVWCYDPGKFLAGESAIDVSMLDGDLCFISDPGNPFWT